MEGLQSGPKILKNYQTVFIGWMDPKTSGADLKSMRYESEKDWIKYVNNLNSYFMPTQFSAWLHGKRIINAKTMDEEPPDGSQLYIRFNKAVLYLSTAEGAIPEIHKSYIGWEALDVEMSFIDVKSGNELHKVHVAITDRDANPGSYSFEGQI